MKLHAVARGHVRQACRRILCRRVAPGAQHPVGATAARRQHVFGIGQHGALGGREPFPRQCHHFAAQGGHPVIVQCVAHGPLAQLAQPSLAPAPDQALRLIQPLQQAPLQGNRAHHPAVRHLRTGFLHQHGIGKAGTGASPFDIHLRAVRLE